MNPGLDEINRRTLRYWYIDGLAEMAVGGVFLLLGLFFLFTDLVPSGIFKAILGAVIFPIFLIGSMYLGGKLVAKVKSRLTYPRTGFVAYRRKRSKRGTILMAAIAVIVMLLLGAAADSSLTDFGWMALMDGLILGIISLYIGKGLVRFYLLSGASFAAGILFAFLGLNDYLGHGSFYTTMGLLFIVSGGVTLVDYLRQHPDTEEEIL